jgi:uncharacterized phage-associated protein
MTTAESAARYLLHLAATDREPSPITQMHLHKLLYFAQGWSLAVRSRPLFNEDIQAWNHGPVVPALRPMFQRFGRNPIDRAEGADDIGVTPDDRTLLDSIWRQYRRYSASGLRAITHRQAPWADARTGLKEGDRGRQTITLESLSKYFHEEYAKACRRRGVDPDALAAARERARRGEVISWDQFKRDIGVSA